MHISGTLLPSGTVIHSPEELDDLRLDSAQVGQPQTLWLHVHLNDRLRGVHKKFSADPRISRWLNNQYFAPLRDLLLHIGNVAEAQDSGTDVDAMPALSHPFDWRAISFRYEDAEVITSDVVAWWARDVLFTVATGEADIALALQQNLAQVSPKNTEGTPAAASAVAAISGPQPATIVAHLVRTTVADFVNIEQLLADQLTEIENNVFNDHETADLSRVYRLKREVLEAQRAATNNLAAIDALPEQIFRAPQLDPRYFNQAVSPALTAAQHRLVGLLQQVERRLSDDSMLVTDIINVHLNQVSVRQNDDMRKISAWAAIIAVPTFVAGVYGMNFANMPELTWQYGYAGSMVAMAAISIVLYRVFKRSGWL